MSDDYIRSKATIYKAYLFWLIIGAITLFCLLGIYYGLLWSIITMGILHWIWTNELEDEDDTNIKFDLLHEFADVFIKYRPIKKWNKDLLQTVINDYGFRRPKVFLSAFEKFIKDEKRDASYM